MKVYVVNVNNCEAYSDYYEGNRGVYSSREKAIDAMTAQGFDKETKIRLIPWSCSGKDWLEDGEYDREEYRIEKWDMDERTCKLEPLEAFYVTVNMLDQTEWGVCSNCGTASPIDATYCCECGAKVVGE